MAAVVVLGVPERLTAQIDVSRLGYTDGDPAAPVEVVEFADFGCSFCGLFVREVKPLIAEEFIRTGRIRWRQVPIQFGGFRNSAAANRAAECAGEQGRFWPMHDLLYEHQRDWQRPRRPTELLREYAAAAGLDLNAWEACHAGEGGRERTRLNTRAGRRLRLRGTPTFFINGGRVVGALPLEEFRQLIIRAEDEVV